MEPPIVYGLRAGKKFQMNISSSILMVQEKEIEYDVLSFVVGSA